MFGKEKKTMAFNGSGNTTTLIAKGTEIVGDINFSGNLEVEGKVRGSIVATGAGEASARVLENGEVEGDIRVPSVIVNGAVKGDVYSSNHIELAAKAKVEGNVHYNLIEMVKGAQVNGSLVYSAGNTAAARSDTAAGKMEAGKAAAKDKSEVKAVEIGANS